MIIVKKTGLLFGLLFLLFIICSANQNYSLPEALKVYRAIDKIQAESQVKGRRPLHKIEISESELNSYIAYRIEKEKEQIMKELRLKLLTANRVQGKMLIDISRYRFFIFLPPRMDLYFEGHLQVESGKVRLNFKKLFLEKQPVPVIVLDLISYISAQADRTEAPGIHDWFELPLGIKDIKTRAGNVMIYY